MQREAGLVVVVVLVLVLVAHEVYLAWSLARTRVRLRSLDRFVDVLAGIVDFEAKRAATSRAADLERLAAVEQGQAPALATAQARGTELDDDDACTKVWIGPPAALVEAAARGANPSSQATPRAFLSMDVAPRAAASPPPLSRAAQLAAGLARPTSTRSAPHAPPVRVRTETLAGMSSPLPRAPSEGDASYQRPSSPSLNPHDSAASTRPPAGPAPIVAVARFPPTLLSMQAHSAPPHEPPTRREAITVSARLLDDDGDATTVFDAEPPRYAARSVALRPPPLLAPLAHPDLIGSEDIADEAARPSLGPEEPTPPRGMRARKGR